MAFDNDINNLNMLVLPGGGIKGYMPALTMQKICNEFNINEKKFIDKFDVVGGTSIGGIMALALACGITPSELVKLFETERHNIFPGNWKAEWICFFDFAMNGTALYNRKGLVKAILKVIPNADKIKIKDLPKRVILTTLKMEHNGNKTTNTPLYITNISSLKDSEITKEFTVLEAACMTSAAPLYFEPVEKDGANYIDGGVWRNNPVTAVINAMRSEFIYCRRQCVLTIGCGKQDFTMERNKAKRDKLLTKHKLNNLKLFTGLGIIMNVLDSAMGGAEEASHHDSQLYEDYSCLDNKCYYYRFQPSLDDTDEAAIDNVTDKFFKYMHNKVDVTFKKEKQNIKNFYERMSLECD